MGEQVMTESSSPRNRWVFDPTVVERPLRYFPVTLGGEVVGYLWASEADDGHASFVRRMSSPHDTLLIAARWSTRLRQSEAEGLTPSQAIGRWVGLPEDAEAGGIAAHVKEQRAPDLRTLQDLANPVHVRNQPAESSRPTHDAIQPGYAISTETEVRYLPVTRGGKVIGYLWASDTEDAACYVQRVAAGTEGFIAGDEWKARLDESKAAGLTPIQALHRWIGAPDDPDAGRIALDAEEQEASSLHTLERLAYGIDEEEST